MTSCIKRVANSIFRESKGCGLSTKEIWWWYEEVQVVIRLKRSLPWCRDNNTYENYTVANREAKRLSERLDSRLIMSYIASLGQKDEERNIYKLGKIREMKTRDLKCVKCIKDEDQWVLVKEEEIKERWKRYFDKFLMESILEIGVN